MTVIQHKAFRILVKVLLGLALLLLMLFGALWSVLKIPAVQNYAVQKAVTFIRSKTHTRVELKRIDLSFPQSLVLEGVFLEDKTHDTLLSIRTLKVGIHMLALLNRRVSVQEIELDSAYVHLARTASDSTFNFQFLLDAFSGDKPPLEATKDTSSTGWEIAADHLRLQDCRFVMDDAFAGMHVHADLPEATLELDELDLHSKAVELGDIVLRNARAEIRLTKMTEDTTQPEGGGWDLVRVSSVTIDHVECRFRDEMACTDVWAKVGRMKLNESSMSLWQQTIESEGFELDSSTAFIQLERDTTSVDATKEKDANTGDWSIALKKLQLGGNTFKLDFTNVPAVAHGTDWNHLYLKGVSADAEDLYYHGLVMHAAIAQLKAQERSGLGIRNLQVDFDMDVHKIELKELSMQTNYSSLGHYASLHYKSLEDLNAGFQFSCELEENQVALEDVLLLQPQLRQNELLQNNAAQRIRFTVKAKGDADRLELKQLTVALAQATQLDVKGTVQHMLQPEQLRLDLLINNLRTTSVDIYAMVLDSLLPSSVAFPDTVTVKGDYKGSLNTFLTHLQVNSTFGNASLEGNATGLQDAVPRYDLKLTTQGFHLGRLLKQESLGRATAKAKVKGAGKQLESMKTTVEVFVDRIELNHYAYRSIHASGSLDTGWAEVLAEIADSNLHADLKGRLNLNASHESVDFKLHLKGVDFKALKVTEEQVLMSARGEVAFKGNSMRTMNGHLAVRDILLVKNNKEYKIDSLVFANLNENGNTQASLNSSMIAASFEGNMDLLSVVPAVQKHIDRYFRIMPAARYEKTAPQNFRFKLQINDTPVLREVIFPDLTSYTTVRATGGFNSDSARLWTNLDLPELQYADLTMKEFSLRLNSDREQMTYSTGWELLKSGDIAVQETKLSGGLAHDTASIQLLVRGAEKQNKLELRSRLSRMANERFRFHLQDGGFALQGNEWVVDKDNFIEFGPRHLYIHRLNVSSGTQHIKAQSDSAHLSIEFHRFDLHTLSQVVEKDDSLVQGTVNGHIRIKDLFSKAAFTSDISIKHLAFKQSKIGDLNLQANNLTENRYTMKLLLTGMNNRVRASGYYAAKMENTLNFDLQIDSLQLASIESFTGGQLAQSKGRIKGNLHLSGSVKEPVMDGTLHFIKAGSRITFLNEYMTMRNETITLESKKVVFQKFVLRDSQGNTAVLNGNVNIADLSEPVFDLKLTTDDFMVLNTTEVNNKLYYGRILLDSKISVKGTPALPVITADVKVEKGSHFSFAIPESEVSTDRGEGIVVFVKDSAYFDRIMLREQDIAGANTIKGISMTAKIAVDRRTSFTLLVDPYTGDSLQVQGRADLLFSLNPDGNMGLSGRYVIDEGSYKATLEGLVPKEFLIVKGSKIEWYGDILDATVDVTARYDTRAKPSGLMSIGSGLTPSEAAAYSQPLKFYIYMMMTGELLHPQISFRLDMPEDEKGAGGGAVYGKLNTINADEAELNKQVFSLLVFNSFMSSSGSSSGGSASDFARSSVSRLMSDQLNKLSSQYIKGVEVDVDLVSYNQNDVATNQKQGNTQLQVGVKKTLFDERLSVQVGGNVMLEGQQNATDPTTTNNSQNITGDVVIEYKLTKNGRYKLKGFRVNQLDGVTNGIITQTGVGFVYSRDYNRTRELFQKKKKRDKKKSRKDVKKEEEEEQ